PDLSQLASSLEKATIPAEKQRLVENYKDALMSAYLKTANSRTVESLTLVSLKALVLAAENYKDHWTALPTQLKTPGPISRIVGSRMAPDGDDIWLIGLPGTSDTAITLDDLIVAIRYAYLKETTPS